MEKFITAECKNFDFYQGSTQIIKNFSDLVDQSLSMYKSTVHTADDSHHTVPAPELVGTAQSHFVSRMGYTCHTGK